MSVLRKELIATNLDCGTAEDVMRILARKFKEAGMVKDTFENAVIEREKTYPTGLPASACDIAIPHTMAEHVITPGVAVATLKTPVEFRQMGSPDVALHPRLVIMLAISDPKDQLESLKKIMKVIQNETLLTGIRDAKDEETVMTLLGPALAD